KWSTHKDLFLSEADTSGLLPSAADTALRLESFTQTFFAGSNCLTVLAGFPVTTEYGGTLRVTAELAPTTECSPITSSPFPHTTVAPNPIQHPSPIRMVPPFVIPWLGDGSVASSNAWVVVHDESRWRESMARE